MATPKGYSLPGTTIDLGRVGGNKIHRLAVLLKFTSSETMTQQRNQLKKVAREIAESQRGKYELSYRKYNFPLRSQLSR